MAKTFTAPFAQTNKTGVVQVTTTTATIIGTAGADGAILTHVSALPDGTVTATRLRLQLSKDAGVTKRTISTVLLDAYTESTSTAPNLVEFANITETTPIRLEAGDELYVVADVAQAAGITFVAEWTDF